VTDRGAVFVLPSRTAGQQGPVAAWVSTAGWASGARRVLGSSWIVTPLGIHQPEVARRAGSHIKLATPIAPTWRRHVPNLAKTLAKDIRQYQRARSFRVPTTGPWSTADISFVWQRHDLFHDAGLRLARHLSAPSVLFVPATLVWESQQWSVERPGWAPWVERHGETAKLVQADLIACGSEIVAAQVERLGVSPERILITPSGVDPDLFTTDRSASSMRRDLRIDDRFVIGWIGSFRRFHAIEQAVLAASRVENSLLLLVGDGPERAAIRRYAQELGVPVRFTGTIPHERVPDYLAAMDVGLVLAAEGQPFHYSPLKLAEYLAAGLPVVAPDIAQIRDRLTDGIDGVLSTPGDADALAGHLKQLRDDPILRARLRDGALDSAQRRWSWDCQIDRVLDTLDGLPRRSSTPRPG